MVEFSAFLSDNDAFFYELFCLMIVMRLLSSLKHDESERGIFHLGRALVKNGHTSIVVTSADPEHALVKRLERDGTIYHQLMMPKKSWWSLLQVIPLRRLIENTILTSFTSTRERLLGFYAGRLKALGSKPFLRLSPPCMAFIQSTTILAHY